MRQTLHYSSCNRLPVFCFGVNATESRGGKKQNLLIRKGSIMRKVLRILLVFVIALIALFPLACSTGKSVQKKEANQNKEANQEKLKHF